MPRTFTDEIAGILYKRETPNKCWNLAGINAKRRRQMSDPKRGGPDRNERVNYQQEDGVDNETPGLGSMGVHIRTKGEFPIKQEKMIDEEKQKKEEEGNE